METQDHTPQAVQLVSTSLEHLPNSFSFSVCAELLGMTSEAAYKARCEGRFPIRVIQLSPRKLTCLKVDVIRYFTAGISQTAESSPVYKKKFKAKTGRPTKRESLEAQRRGLSVPELRAQAVMEGV